MCCGRLLLVVLGPIITNHQGYRIILIYIQTFSWIFKSLHVIVVSSHYHCNTWLYWNWITSSNWTCTIWSVLRNIFLRLSKKKMFLVTKSWIPITYLKCRWEAGTCLAKSRSYDLWYRTRQSARFISPDCANITPTTRHTSHMSLHPHLLLLL